MIILTGGSCFVGLIITIYFVYKLIHDPDFY